MNPGIGAPELLILLILALVVVGPKDLPLMMRKLGRFAGQARAMARDFQRSFDELGREAEIAELREEIESLKRANPVEDVRRELKQAEADLRELDNERLHPRVVEAKKKAAAREKLERAREMRDGDSAESKDVAEPETPSAAGGEDAAEASARTGASGERAK